VGRWTHWTEGSIRSIEESPELSSEKSKVLADLADRTNLQILSSTTPSMQNTACFFSWYSHVIWIESSGLKQPEEKGLTRLRADSVWSMHPSFRSLLSESLNSTSVETGVIVLIVRTRVYVSEVWATNGTDISDSPRSSPSPAQTEIWDVMCEGQNNGRGKSQAI
jgi:hypothetical protein